MSSVSSPALTVALEAAVPLWIIKTRDLAWYERKAAASRCSDEVAAHGDTLQYGGRKGEAAKVFNALAEGLAHLAFSPGGVTFAGLHWQAVSLVKHSGYVPSKPVVDIPLPTFQERKP